MLNLVVTMQGEITCWSMLLGLKAHEKPNSTVHKKKVTLVMMLALVKVNLLLFNEFCKILNKKFIVNVT